MAKRGITGAQAERAMSLMAPVMTPVGLLVISLITGVIGGFIVALIVSISHRRATAVRMARVLLDNTSRE